MKALASYALVAVTALLLSVAGGAYAKCMTILPLGDSITASNTANLGYRYYLWKSLVQRGTKFNMIGSRDFNSGGNPTFPKVDGQRFDSDHEGHSGWRSLEILRGKSSEPENGYLSKWLEAYDREVDVALVHLGTNDATKGSSLDRTFDADETACNLIEIVYTLRQFNPSVTVLLSKIIPLSSSKNANVRAINEKVQDLVASLNTKRSKVVLVDNYTGFDRDWLYDGVHPNAAGQKFIAGNFLPHVPHVTHCPAPAAPAMGLLMLSLLSLRRSRD